MNLLKQRWNPAVGLLALFFLYVLAGILLSFAYSVYMERMENLAGLAIAPVFFGAMLGGAVFGLKRFFKIVFDLPALIMIIGGSTAVYFMMWGGFPLRGEAEFLALAEWEMPEILAEIIGEWELPVIAMRLLGILEAAAIALPPVYMAFKRTGVYLPRPNRWADVRLMDYGFIPFTDRELDKLAVGNTDIFMRKPIDLTGLERIHGVALCYVDNRLTEYLAVFKADWNRQGYIEKGQLLLLIALTVEQIEALQAALYEIHRESENEG
jgi:hypothetical protein